MAVIKKTRISTPNPIDICQGVALMPWAGTIRAGKTLSSQPNKPIVNIKPKAILLWRFRGSAGYQLFSGICGPAYAADFMIDGATNGRDVTLTVSDDRAAAGLFAGLKATFPIHFQIDSGSVTYSWSHGFGVKWKKSLEKRLNPDIDILKLIIKLIEKLMEDKSDTSDVKEGDEVKGETEESKKEREKDESKKPDVISLPTWGMYDARSGEFNQKGGQISPEPTFTITVNLTPLYPPLEAVDKAFKTLWGGFSLGPKIKLIVPVEISFHRVFLDNEEVKGLEYSGGQLRGQTDSAVTAADNLRVDVNHNPKFTIGASFYMSVSVCKLFSFDPETDTLRLDKLLGVEVSLGTYCSEYASSIGDVAANTDSPGKCSASNVDVILDP